MSDGARPPVTLDRSAIVGVLGAGAMGSGIARVAAAFGHRVIVLDANADQVERARLDLQRALARDTEKGRTTADEALDQFERVDIMVAGEGTMDPFRDCRLVIEAIVESLPAKRDAFARIERAVAPDCAVATNTSSLSVTSIAAGCDRPERVLGAHFFNPATIMPLVEIIPGVVTDFVVLERVRQLVDAWGKTTVVAADTPGFIVNRIARPFYGEAIRLLEERAADAATIDWAMRELGGFRMGPFELMDFIGHDVNFAVTRSVFEAFHYDRRYVPSFTQQRLVEAGRLGRKSKLGFFDYRDGAPSPQPDTDRTLAAAIVERIVAMLINEAADAVLQRVATPADIDLAMVKGVGYPRGLLAWCDEINAGRVLQTLDALQREYGDDRYRPSAQLRRMARDGSRFFSAR